MTKIKSNTQNMSSVYWSWTQQKRDNHNAYMRNYHIEHYKPRKKVARTKGPRSFRYNVKLYIDSVKISIGKCEDCNLPCEEWNVIMFAFDHLEPNTKSFSLSSAGLQKKCTQLLIDTEIAKCELVCHNCHSYRTWVTRAHVHSNKTKAAKELPLLALMYHDK